MFEVLILLVNVILPSAVSILGLAAAWALRRRLGPASASTNSGCQTTCPPAVESRRGILTAVGMETNLLTLIAAIAINAAFGLRTEWAVWHADAWMRLPTGVALVALMSVISSAARHPALTWSLRAASVLAAAAIVFPTGEAWDFLVPKQTFWLASIAISTLGGWFLSERRPARVASILGMGWIALCAAAAFLTGQSFLKVTEPLLAVASVIGVFSLAGLRRGSANCVAAAAGPCLFALGAAVASAQFNSFLELPDGLSLLAMASPAVAATLTYRRRALSESRTWKSELAVTVIVCLALAISVILWTQLALPAGGYEW